MLPCAWSHFFVVFVASFSQHTAQRFILDHVLENIMRCDVLSVSGVRVILSGDDERWWKSLIEAC